MAGGNDLMDILLIINNYFHDLFTAMLAAAGFFMVISRRVYGLHPRPENTNFYLGLYQGYVKLARFSLAGILLAGIPRVLFFKTYEFIPAVSKGLVAALAFKHLLLFGAVGLGLYWWHRLAGEAAQLTREGGNKLG
jgi:hypothetical protein